MKKNITIFLILLIAGLFGGVNYVKAASFDVSISGTGLIEPIHGFTIWLDVDNDFSINSITLGDAIPPKLTNFGWVADSPKVIQNDPPPWLFKYGASDWDYVMSLTPNPLRDGVLFSLDYTGTIIGPNLIQFANINGENLFRGADNPSGPVMLGSISDTGLSFTAVPIPATALLFLSGIFGLVGIRRFRGRKLEG